MSEQKIIHVRKFDNGRRTPAEYFREKVYAHTECSFCGDKPGMRIRYIADAEEFKKRNPDVYKLLCIRIGGDPAFDTTYGKMIHVNSEFACDRCKTAARKMAAHKPDWIIAEFEEMGLEENHKLVIPVSR